jgi:uncharacterized DUF497 family protein
MVAIFEWDPDKDAENQRKHGVSFAQAQNVIRIIGAGYWRKGRKPYEAHSKGHE